MNITRTVEHSSITHLIELHRQKSVPLKTHDGIRNFNLNYLNGNIIPKALQLADVSVIIY